MAIVVEIEPINPATGTRVTLRMAAGDDRRLAALNDVRWWPGVFQPPSLQMEGWDGDFSGAAVIASASLAIDPVALRKNDPASPSYRWAGAPLRVYEGNAGDAWGSWAQRFIGRVEDYSTDSSGRYSFSAKVDGEPFEANLLSASYAGTGGNEGGADLKGKSKPMVFGHARNVEPVLLDAVNNVYQVHGYGSIQAITAVYERAANFVLNGGTNVGNFASYAALVAATIVEGDFGTCLAEGLVRLGAPPAGLITLDVDGDNGSGFVNTTASIITRLCALAGVDTSRIDSASLTALATAVPYPINLYIANSITLIDMVQALARPCNAQAILSWTGSLRIVRFGTIPAATQTLDGQGRARPAVLSVQEIKTSPPYRRIEMRGNRCWRPHSKDEIAFAIDPDIVLALAEIASISSDSVLSKGSEKQKATIDYSAIVNDLGSLNQRYTDLGSPSDLTSAKSAADTAVAALTTYLTGLTPSWSDTSVDTPIAAATYVTKWTDAYDKISDYRAAITGRAGTSQKTIYLRSLATPSTPTGNTPSGWSLSIPAGTDTAWQSTGAFDPTGVLIGVWATPRSITTGAPRGAYNSATIYYLTNTVTFGGGTYSALQDTFSGQAPSGTASATAYWGVVAAPGEAGAPATPPSAFTPSPINLTSGTAVNLRTLADAAGYTGHSDATITFNVPSGVTIRGLNSGGIGIDTGSWPSGYTITLTLVVQSGGVVDGGGGDGGSASYGSGSNGGDAIYCRIPMSVTINSGGIVRGGGGGGASGYGQVVRPRLTVPSDSDPFNGGGGGGGGRPNGAGGSGEAGYNGGSNGTSGTTATTTTTGSAGSGYVSGGAGGSFGAAGSSVGSTSGGAAGYAVRKNGNTVGVTNNGTMTGTAA